MRTRVSYPQNPPTCQVNAVATCSFGTQEAEIWGFPEQTDKLDWSHWWAWFIWETLPQQIRQRVTEESSSVTSLDTPHIKGKNKINHYELEFSQDSGFSKTYNSVLGHYCLIKNNLQSRKINIMCTNNSFLHMTSFIEHRFLKNSLQSVHTQTKIKFVKYLTY